MLARSGSDRSRSVMEPIRASRAGKSSPLAGSSSTSSRGFAISARAMRTRCRSPLRTRLNFPISHPVTSDLFEQFPRTDSIFVGIPVDLRLHCSRNAGQDDLLDREPVVHALMRIDDADLFAQLKHAGLAEAAAQHLDCTARRISAGGSHGKQRSLAGAVRAKHCPMFARFYRPADVGKDHGAIFKPDGHMLQSYQGIGQRPARPLPTKTVGQHRAIQRFQLKFTSRRAAPINWWLRQPGP